MPLKRLASPFSRRPSSAASTPPNPAVPSGPDCPGCGRGYDSGKRRPQTDTCGHVRCRACVRDKHRKCAQCACVAERGRSTAMADIITSADVYSSSTRLQQQQQQPVAGAAPAARGNELRPLTSVNSTAQQPRCFVPINAVDYQQPPPPVQSQEHHQKVRRRLPEPPTATTTSTGLPSVPSSSFPGVPAPARGGILPAAEPPLPLAFHRQYSTRSAAAAPGAVTSQNWRLSERRSSRPLSGVFLASVVAGLRGSNSQSTCGANTGATGVGGEADLAGSVLALHGLPAGVTTDSDSNGIIDYTGPTSVVNGVAVSGPGRCTSAIDIQTRLTGSSSHVSGQPAAAAARSARPSTSLSQHHQHPAPVAAAASAWSIAFSKDAHLRRSLRDDWRLHPSTSNHLEHLRQPVQPVPVRPRDGVIVLTQDHFRPSPPSTMTTHVTAAGGTGAARRPGCLDTSGTTATSESVLPDGSSGPGGLSLGSTASNDTGYSSIGNNHRNGGYNHQPASRVTSSEGVGLSVKGEHLIDPGVLGSGRGAADSGAVPNSAADGDDSGDLRPSVAELRQRFQQQQQHSSGISTNQQLTLKENIVLTTNKEAASGRVDQLPPSPEIARHDLLTRLGVLLGDSSTSLQGPVPPTLLAKYHPPRSTSSPNMFRGHPGTSAAAERHCVDTAAPIDDVCRNANANNGTCAVRVDTEMSSAAPVNNGSTLSPTTGLTVTYNPTFSPGGSSGATGRDVSTDSVTSLGSSVGGASGSISPPSTWRPSTVQQSPRAAQIASLQRPHSVNAAAAGPAPVSLSPDEAVALSQLSKRRSATRLSARAGHTTFQNERRGHDQLRGHFPSIARSQLHLTRINFEVARREPLAMYVGREWLFRDIEETILSCGAHCKGVLIVGGAGFGKTAVIDQLVELSCFGEGRNTLVTELAAADGCHGLHNGKGRPVPVGPTGLRTNGSIHGSSASLASSSTRSGLSMSIASLTATSPPPIISYDPLRRLATRLVGYHFCQIDNNITCTVPEFVHSLAAHLIRSPALAAYHELLVSRPPLHAVLGIRQCIANASRAFVQGVLEPLTELQQAGVLPRGEVFLIAIDSLNEAAFHEPDYGDTIASFLARHMELFPSCLRLIVTTRSGSNDASNLPLKEMSIDGESAVRDVADYVGYRVAVTPSIQANIEPIAGRLNDSVAAHIKLAAHIATLSAGCMLYVKLVLDLIERGSLVLKSSGFRVIPVNLSEVFQLEMNLRFPTSRAFERAVPVLSVCLASLYPLTAGEIFEAVQARFVMPPGGHREELERVMELVAGLLLRRRDSTFMFFHPTFREWLMRREENESTKFLCELRLGHALLALKMSRADAPLPADRVLELGHHVLKAHIYKSSAVGGKLQSGSVSSRDLQAYWVCLSTDCLSQALVSQRNLFSPNVKVSRLLLLAGANPNLPTDVLNCAPPLCVAARDGFADVVSLFVEFAAEVNATDNDGVPALSYAARRGHVNVIHLLTTRHAKVNQVDNEGWCPLVHAASHGQLDAASFLLQCDWSLLRDRRPTRNEALQQALSAAARNGHTSVCEFLLSLQKITGDGFNINTVDTLFGETALTAACAAGHIDTVVTLLERGANPLVTNAASLPPLLCTASSGQWQVIDILLGTHQGAAQLKQMDKTGRTALMLAAAEGHLSVVELLLSKGAPVTSADREGLTALSWASIRGHLHCVQLLLERGSDIDHDDKIRRTPLHLTSFNGHEQVVQCLLERGADMEHEDISGMRPLDRAISCRHTAVVICFLRKGAKIGPSTWAMAAGKPDIMMLLLNKLLDDGNVLYKKNRIRDAAYRYQYALKKLPVSDPADDVFDSDQGTFVELRVNLALNLSRCKRKLMDIPGAIELATSVLEIKPNSFEAYYARARAKRDDRQYESALQDLTIALSLAPNNRELHRLLVRVEEECRDSRDVSRDLNRSAGSMSRHTDDSSRSSGIPDIVPSDGNTSFGSDIVHRLKEETSL